MQKVTNNPVELANIECGIECGLDLALSILYSCTNFAHNVSFSEKLGNFLETIFGQNCSVWYVDLWNRTEILIDCHIIRGQHFKIPARQFLSQLFTQCNFFLEIWEIFQNYFLVINGSVWYVDLWNQAEILIDCHIIRG